MVAQDASWLTRVHLTCRDALDSLEHRYKKLNLSGKLFLWSLVLFYICLGLLVYFLTPKRILQFLYDKAQAISHIPLGWVIFVIAIVVSSFPPLIGYTTVVTLCGFAYGTAGFPIAASATVIGSVIVFVVLRLLFSERLKHWSVENDKWKALEAVILAKGLPLIVLIRLSSFPPWAYSNTLFASIETVHLWQFIVATCFLLPKRYLLVFIGSRMAALSDGNQRDRMDTQTKIINGALVAGGLLFAVIASLSVYHLVLRQIRRMEVLPGPVDGAAAEPAEGVDENSPLLRSSIRDIRPETW